MSKDASRSLCLRVWFFLSKLYLAWTMRVSVESGAVGWVRRALNTGDRLN
jgi:hypothetical protein